MDKIQEDYTPNYMHKPIDNIRKYRGYEMFIVRKDNIIPIHYGDVSWEDSIDTLGMKLSFSTPRNIQDRHMKRYDILRIGDKVMFKNKDVTIFTGMVVDMDIEKYKRSVTAYDYGYLLNQNNILIQFNKINSKKAIQDLCSRENVPVGKLSGLNATITKVYQNESVAAIIKDIIEQNELKNGYSYRMEIRDGKLVIEPYSNLLIKPITKLAANVGQFDPTLLPGNITKSHSLTNMVNKVVVVTENKKSFKTVYTGTNKDSISQYGLFQEVVSVSKEEIQNPRSIANNILKEKSNVGTDITVEMLGDDKVRAGRTIILENETFGLTGKFLIKHCTQTFHNNVRKMNLDIKQV